MSLMELLENSTKRLANGVEMPRIGLGVYKMTEPEVARKAITHALESGYRHIDTASLYANEKEVGKLFVLLESHAKRFL